MAVKRIVSTDFWTDGKVDEFSPEDKYFMLYLLTNPFTTQLGIYEISIKQAAFQLGWTTEGVRKALDRFQTQYNMILFSEETKEVAIKNYLRHSVVKGGKPVEDCLLREIRSVKNKDLIRLVFRHIARFDDLCETVQRIIFDFDLSILNKNGKDNENGNENENDNDNDVSYHDSSHDSSHDSYHDSYHDSSIEDTGGKKPAMPVKALSFDYSSTTFSSVMITAVENWLKYKWERREVYKPTGLQALISQLQDAVNQYGEQAVIDLIRKCMASNWRGIIFDKLKQVEGHPGVGNGGHKNPPTSGVDRILEMMERGDFDE